jgi:hypothetical protein
MGPISDEFAAALQRAQRYHNHDMELGIYGPESHDTNCDICDRREPAQIPGLVGRWGTE